MKRTPLAFKLVLKALLALLIAGLALNSIAFAHLMVAQKGTLNLSGTGAYLVVSLAVSSLKDVDDDEDGLLSAEELNAHKLSIIEQLQAGLRLSDKNASRPLEGVMLTLSPADSQEGQPADQLIVMGRYALADANEALSFQANLWGTKTSEQSLSLSITNNLEDEQLLILTPQQPQAKLYASTLMVLMNYLKLGITHVLAGLDHLLFLLVVISAGLRWKKVFIALSIFTLGHALSLIAVVFAGLSVPVAIVEPAIAATIIGLALYDFWLARKKIAPSVSRLALIFGCSLIHGLGLGDALATLGINPTHQAITLLGFNLGIELAQLSVAALALFSFAFLRYNFGMRSVKTLSAFMTLCAVVAGGVWFVERVIF